MNMESLVLNFLGLNQSYIIFSISIHLFIRVVVSRDRICRTASLFIFIVSPWALMTFI